MKLLYDFLPVLLFFLAYKFADIYVATMVAMVAVLLQTLSYWLKYRRVETLQLVTFGMILILGGTTLFLHNPVFIKWKPTLVNWIFASILFGSHWFGEKNVMTRLLETKIQLPDVVWRRLNLAWGVFFIFSGAINLYVAYNFSENFWVNFKLFGMIGLTVVFVVLQSLYLSKHIIETPG